MNISKAEISSRHPGHDSQSFDSEKEKLFLAALARGDRDAAAALVDATVGPLYRSALKLCGGDPEPAGELVQETYRKAWEALPFFNARCRFFSWLYRIAYTTFLNMQRERGRLVPLEPFHAETLPDAGMSQEECVSGQETRLRLQRAVIDLPDSLRIVVTGFYWAEMPVVEIAQMEQISCAAVRKRMKKALKLIEMVMKEE